MVFTSNYFHPKSGCQGEKAYFLWRNRNNSCLRHFIPSKKKLQHRTNVQLSLLSDLYDQMLKHYFCAIMFCGVNVSWSGAPMKPFYQKTDTLTFHLGTWTSTKLAVHVATISIMEFGKPLLAKYSQVMPQTCAHWQLFPRTVLKMKVHILDQQVHLLVQGISEEPFHDILTAHVFHVSLTRCKYIRKGYGLSQLTYISHEGDTIESMWVMTANRKTKASQLHHRGEFRHISISARWQSWWCSWNLCEPFLRAELLTVEASALAMVANQKTKVFIASPQGWISTQLLYVWVSAQQKSQQCSQNLCTPFLLTVNYRKHLFYYQECNTVLSLSLSNTLWGKH